MKLAQRLLSEIEGYGLKLIPKEDKLVVEKGGCAPRKLIEAIRKNKKDIIKFLEKQRLRQALTHLQVGETAAIRIFSKTLNEEVWLVRDDFKPETLDVELVCYSLKELKELVGIDKQELRKIHLIKKIFPGSKVVKRQ